MLMEAPNTYPASAKRLIRELGIDFERNSESFHEYLFESHGAGLVNYL